MNKSQAFKTQQEQFSKDRSDAAKASKGKTFKGRPTHELDREQIKKADRHQDKMHKYHTEAREVQDKARNAPYKKKMAKKMSNEDFKRKLLDETIKKRAQMYKDGTMAEKDREAYRTSHLIRRK